MKDKIFETFLQAQYRDAMALADQSDILRIEAVPAVDEPPRYYVARFNCHGATCRPGQQPTIEPREFIISCGFPNHYLRRVRPGDVFTWLMPFDVYSPHIRFPAICCGRLQPGTSLVDLLYQVYEIITYTNYAPHDALNPEAAQWARHHQHLFPLDRRPLKRRRSSAAPQREGLSP